MSAALIHDKLFIKAFWEKRITKYTQMTENEELRMKTSALSKLRDEWLMRLENQTKHIKNLNNRRAIKSAEVKQTD